MPGWHAQTKDLVKDRKLLVAGIAPEQHGNRMALFLQWKAMQDMPVMLDSYNILGLKVVPITLLIDEAGIIRYRNPSGNDLDAFMKLPPATPGTAPKAPRPTAFFPGLDPAHLDPSTFILKNLPRGIEASPGPGPETAAGLFQLGVAFRKRYDSPDRQSDDFSHAVGHWRRALALDPSNYIWRRRLQQYGPRLDKPYPFYNWVNEARREITARGDKPHPLVAEPTGAELALPAGNTSARDTQENPPHPDPDDKLPRATGTLLSVTKTVVPHTTKPGSAVRVFVETTPLPPRSTTWNDEAGRSSIRVIPPRGWTAHPSVLSLPPTGSNPLHEPRRAEFELRRSKKALPPFPKPPVCTLQVFTHLCHGREGTCELLRRDLTIPLPHQP